MGPATVVDAGVHAEWVVSPEMGPASPASPKLGAEPGRSVMPEMNPDDTSATGMLRLEDLDAHFAETIFGDEDAQASADNAQKVAI